MNDSVKNSVERIKSMMRRVEDRLRTRRMQRVGIALLAVLALYTLGGFFGLPVLVRHILTTQVAASLKRTVTVGEISFNPFRLRLELDRLHIADRDPAKRFVDLGLLRVKVSWTSLYRLAPVIKELEIDRPALQLVRTGQQEFNFSDLLAPRQPPPPPSKPVRFALSNIRLHEGDVRFDDQVLKQQHKLEHIELDLPFVANLPADTKIFVQPLLRMLLDDSPVKIGARALPFAKDPESVVALKLDHLNLASYVGYVPVKMPVKVPQGTVSAFLQVHFAQTATIPTIRLNGEVVLDDLEVRDNANAPLIGFRQAIAHLNDVEPLNSVFQFGAITMDGLNAELVRNRDGTTNLTPVMAPPATAPPTPALATSAPTTSRPVASPIAIAPAITANAPVATALPTIAPAAAATATATATATASPNPAAAPAGVPIPTAADVVAPSIAASAPSMAPPSGAAPGPEKRPLDLALESFTLTNGAVKLTDKSLASPAIVGVQNINVALQRFAIGANASSSAYNFAGNLGGGGSIAVKGNLDLAKSQVTSEVTIEQVDLPSFQAYAQSATVATLGTGKLNAHANLLTSFAANQFNLHIEPASFSIDNLRLNAPGGKDQPVQWSRFGATITEVDLATHQAVVSEVHGDGIHLFVRRERDGKLSLLSLLRTQPGSPPENVEGTRQHHPRPSRMTVTRDHREDARAANSRASVTVPMGPSTPEWRYKIASIAISQAQIDSEDDVPARPAKASVTPLNLNVKNFSSDFSKPIDLEIDGVLNHRGSFKFNGPVVIAPLKADLHVLTQRLDLGVANSYMPQDLNATIKSALLTTTGIATAAMVRNNLHVNYRGSATLGNVRMLDKITNDDFVRWNSLNFDRIDFAVGQSQPRVHVGAIALSDFYARVILNADGRLNLSDITSNPAQAPKSLTREQTGMATPGPLTPLSTTKSAPVATVSPTSTPAAAPVATASPAAAAVTPSPAVPKPLGADIALGQITLHGGHVDYSDFFIKPNYRANMTDVSGKVGAFGTRTTMPAGVLIEGQINGSAPLHISGSINPLAPLAAVDLTAKANGIELTDLSAYSVKYTGYPITKGSLTVDVRYVLANRNLTASNHIFLDQLTFGDKVESPTAMNLPMRLAVAILKDSKGQINLDVPISGSLNDPQFSFGGIILHAFMNILTKAVTAPFRLLAGAIGGIAGGGSEDLSYVEFAPGRTTLAADARKRLDTVAIALNARSALKLSIAGRVDPQADKPGLHEAKVDDQVLARLNESEDTNRTADETIPPDLYNKYLKKVYKAAKFQKPTDMLGLDKSLAPDEMKKLLVTNMEVTDDDLKHLADARAQAVRKYLSTKIDPARLFTVASKLDATGIDDQGKASRADLALQ